MTRGPATFRQRDLTRALKATVAAGIEVAGIEIGKDGKMVIFAVKSEELLDGAANDVNPWNEVLRENM
jgi:hypothetical protein